VNCLNPEQLASYLQAYFGEEVPEEVISAIASGTERTELQRQFDFNGKTSHRLEESPATKVTDANRELAQSAARTKW